MEMGPVFIGGLDRSGKTTLRGFLQSLPNLSIPAVGSNLWTYFYNQYGDLSDPDNYQRCMDAMLRYKQVRFLEPDPERIRTEFQQGPATYARLFALLQQHHAQREGRPRWGEQTGLIERYADQVFDAYPGARMIQMIRDPRDRYAGSLELWPKGKARAGGAAARWLYSTRLARRNLARYPHNYLLVCYERLVREPEATLRKVCAFIGEEFDPAILAMGGAPEQREKMIRRSHGQASAGPLSSEYIGIYRGQIPAVELAFMQSVLRRRLIEFGYQLDAISMSPAERRQYLFKTYPVNLARMAAWLVREFLQHHFPSIYGRKFGANMRVDAGSRAAQPADAARTARGE